MRRLWYIVIALVAICAFTMLVLPAMTSQARALLQATVTDTVEASVTASSAPASATSAPASATSAPASATSAAASSTAMVVTNTPIVITTTPIIITATPLTATATPIVVTATPTPVPPTSTRVPGGVIPTGRTNRAAIRFMTQAMDANQTAVDLANDCLNKAQDTQVLALCNQMSTAHANDIQQLHNTLLSMFQVDYLPTSLTTLQKMGATPEATTTAGAAPSGPGVVVALTNLQGVSYDVAWLETMTDVHTDLIAAANRILTFPIDPALRTMVQQMRSTAVAEIGTMQASITRLGGSH